MGFFKDLGNFATGAIERDRELTNEKLKMRAMYSMCLNTHKLKMNWLVIFILSLMNR